MDTLNGLSARIAQYFSSTASFYVKQVSDGSYRKTPGRVTAQLVHHIISSEQSIACYQRNSDHTIGWICFDFDILKSKIGTEEELKCEEHLLSVAGQFVDFLKRLTIAHLIEFSGNRGIHIWVHLESPVYPHTAYEIVTKLIDHSELSINRSLIGLDLFPSSASHKSSFGKAVKIPLSKHTKSRCYSLLVAEMPSGFLEVKKGAISNDDIEKQLSMLDAYRPESVFTLEEKLSCTFQFKEPEQFVLNRIRALRVSRSSISIDDILGHWSRVPLMAPLVNDVNAGKLNNARRQLVVGLFNNVVGNGGEKLGQPLLLQLFSKMQNFDVKKTEIALDRLKSLPFPAQDTIESICNVALAERLNPYRLAEMIIPDLAGIEDGLFNVSEVDMRVVRIAEANYLYQNDEVRCIPVVDELAICETDQLIADFDARLAGTRAVEFYRHYRKEKGKKRARELITLSARDRLFSTWAIKHLDYVFDFDLSPNSYGYRMNRNFSGGHVFKPWLYQWIEFLHDIGDFLNDDVNSEYFVVKADIKSFYDSIPQDNLERLILTGFNSVIAAKISSLQGESTQRYKDIVSALLRICRVTNPNGTGVPQGPAFARYLAELYLTAVDEMMDAHLDAGYVLFYHRYVDDIFFVAETEERAQELLSTLRQLLSLLGLLLSDEKTTVTKITNFGAEFDKYRAQAKYAVDAISSNIANATEYEKNVAVLEYNKLIAQQDDNDDAVFLFSHLPGVTFADQYRDKSVLPILKLAFGRGNLFRHVFLYVLNNDQLWSLLDDVEKLTDLQSEVFTSVCLELLCDQRDVSESLASFIQAQVTKLTDTPLVAKHLAYLKLCFGIRVDGAVVGAADLLSCIRFIEEPERLNSSFELIENIRSELNGIDDIGQLVTYLYPLAIKAKVDAKSMEAISQIFAAKISVAARSNTLNINRCGDLIKTPVVANQFYQLICLFTLSDAFSPAELLEKAWAFCSALFSSTSVSPADFRKISWYRNFDYVSLNKTSLNIVATSISQGALWRGPVDRHGIYIHFHNALMVRIFAGARNENFSDLKTVISKISGLGVFYEWLFRDNVDLFPTRAWFLESVTKNDCILLKSGNAILIRRPTDSFISSDAKPDSASASLVGYSDHVVDYKVGDHISVRGYLLEAPDFLSVLKRIFNVIQVFVEKPHLLPNFFAEQSLLRRGEVAPFCEEMCGHEHLIYEDDKGIRSAKVNFGVFVEYLFATVREGSVAKNAGMLEEISVWNFFSMIMVHLNAEKDVAPFLRSIVVLLSDNSIRSHDATFNLAVANALYMIGPMSESASPFARIKAFFERYNKVTPSVLGRYIYKPEVGHGSQKLNLREFADAILRPIKCAHNYRQDISFGLADDIESYFDEVRNLADEVKPDIELDFFKRCVAALNMVTETLSIDGNAYSYDSVVVINPASGINQSFLQEHIFLLQSSEDVYGFENEDKVYLFFVPRELTLCFADASARLKMYSQDVVSGTGSAIVYPEIDSGVAELDLNCAVRVVALHRGLTPVDAETKLRNWLAYLPVAARGPLITLIQAHETMDLDEINQIRDRFDECRRRNLNPFLLKRFSDFGGMHRVLAMDEERGRLLDRFGPDSICSGAEEACLFADIAISGGQIAEAVDYYLRESVGELNGDYFGDSEKHRALIGETIRRLSRLRICTVLHTDQAIDKLKDTFKKHNACVEIVVDGGRNISTTAFFSTSKNISNREKDELIRFFENSELQEQLAMNVFSMNSRARKMLNNKLGSYEELNLVTRHKSTPKKCLDYLTCDLRNLPGSSIFKRIREPSELKSGTPLRI